MGVDPNQSAQNTPRPTSTHCCDVTRAKADVRRATVGFMDNFKETMIRAFGPMEPIQVPKQLPFSTTRLRSNSANSHSFYIQPIGSPLAFFDTPSVPHTPVRILRRSDQVFSHRVHDPIGKPTTQTPFQCAIIKTLKFWSNVAHPISLRVLQSYLANDSTHLSVSNGSCSIIARMIPSVSQTTKPPTPSPRSSVDYVPASSTSSYAQLTLSSNFTLSKDSSSTSSALFEGCKACIISSKGTSLTLRTLLTHLHLFAVRQHSNPSPLPENPSL